MKEIVYVDMDGVVADFDKAMFGLYPFLKSIPIKKRSEKIDKLCSKNKRIFLDLEPIEKAVVSVMFLSNFYEIYFLSTPMWNVPESFMDKRLWLEEHFGKFAHKRLILSHRKDLANGSYLIDDRLTNGSENFKGNFIHFGSDNYKNWDEVLNKLVWEKKKKHGE